MTWKKWLKRTLAIIVVYLVLQTLWLVGQREWQRSAGEREFAETVALTEQTDPDWRWDALDAKRERPPEGKNGAELIPRIKQLTPKEWGHKLNGREMETLVDIPANCRYPKEVLEEVNREEANARAAIELARSMKDYDTGY